MKTIPLIAIDPAPTPKPTVSHRTLEPPARVSAEPYRAYKPRPFTRAERVNPRVAGERSAC